MKRILSLVVIAVMAVFIPYGGWQTYQNYIIFPKPLSQEEIQENKKKELEEAISKAEAGDAKAQYQLALKYHFGRSNLTVNHQKAAQWYQKAAEQGHVKAQYNLGNSYREGRGVDKDLQKAIYWFKEAAEQGFVDAYYNLGSLYYYDVYELSDLEQAYKWYQKAANGGHVKAIAMVGIMQTRGQGVEKNLEEGVKNLEQATEQGNGNAQYTLGQHYENGDGVKRDYVRAGVLYRQAADKNIHEAEKYLDEVYEHCIEVGYWARENTHTCFIAAYAGYENAHAILAYLYLTGHNVPNYDFVKAREIAEPLAFNGNAIAQMVLSDVRVYSTGKQEAIIPVRIHKHLVVNTSQYSLLKAYLWSKVISQNGTVNELPDRLRGIINNQMNIVIGAIREANIENGSEYLSRIDRCAELFYTDISGFRTCSKM